MKFYANPYNTDVQGFYFETNDEFLAKSATINDSFGLPVEEFSIEVIDGTKAECEMIEAIGINQGNLEEVIDFIDGDESDWPAIYYLLQNCDMDFDDAVRNHTDYCIQEGNLLDAASQLADEQIDCIEKGLRDFVRSYFDYDSYANDQERNGDMVEFTFAGATYTCTNTNR